MSRPHRASAPARALHGSSTTSTSESLTWSAPPTSPKSSAASWPSVRRTKACGLAHLSSFTRTPNQHPTPSHTPCALPAITPWALSPIADELIDIDGEDNTTKITRFANYLRMVLPGLDPQVSVLAARALGTASVVARRSLRVPLTSRSRPAHSWRACTYVRARAGRLALAGGTLTADLVDFEIKRALEWLQGAARVS